MSDNISVDDFNQNWTFFMKKIKKDLLSVFHCVEFCEARFECGSFFCRGCDHWLDADLPNRTVFKTHLETKLIERS